MKSTSFGANAGTAAVDELEFIPEAQTQTAFDGPAAKQEVSSSKNRALLATSAEAVQSLGAQLLLGVQSLLQHGSTFGRWQTPRKWSPLAQASTLDVDLRARIVSFLPETQRALVKSDDEALAAVRQAAGEANVNLLDNVASPTQRLVAAGVLTLTRLLVICRMGPAGIGKKAKGRSLDPSTLMRLAYQQLPKLLAVALSKRLADLSPSDGDLGSERFFSHITSADLVWFPAKQRLELEAELKRLHVLKVRGCWSDVPADMDDPSSVTAVSGSADKPQQQQKVDPHLPLPDEYVAEMGRHSLWLIRDLAPSLLTVMGHIRSTWLRSDDLSVGPARVAQRRDEAVRSLLASHGWYDAEGRPIEVPPFNIRFSQVGKRPRGEQRAVNGAATSAVEGVQGWRPRMLADVVTLLKLVQMAHLFVVGLSMGARRSELVTMERQCIVRAPNGMPYAEGRTWKLVDRHDGEQRDWVLPDLAMEAIEQQVKLVTLLDDIGPMAPRRGSEESSPPAVHLWAEIGGGQSDRTKAMMHTHWALAAYAVALGMSTQPGGQSLRVHRFRKTIARLAALALTQAPKVLKDVFGHKNFEMTLYYLLTDKDLQVDVERVARELRVMKAKETVEAIVAAEDGLLAIGGFGGPAAVTVGKAIRVHRDRLHRRGEEWGADSAMELAEILTLRGKAWHLVRPGIICTKFPGTESGPCNKSKGQPEPARCQSHCKHRLEEAFLRDDVDGAIRDAVVAYKGAGERGDDLVQALWAGQVRVHVGRFADLRNKWMQDPLVRFLVETPAEDAEEATA
jgi:integrase